MPRVFTAGSLPFELELFTSSAGDSTSTLSSSAGCISFEVLDFGLLLPGLILVFVMRLLGLAASLWAAENMLEKKLAPGVGGTAFSGVGVSGADTILESLLGPMLVAEPDLALLCDIMLPEGETTTLELRNGELLLFVGDDSTGVGGVLTIAGPGELEDGGVRGRTNTSRDGWLLRLRRDTRDARSSSWASGCEETAELGRESKPTGVSCP